MCYHIFHNLKKKEVKKKKQRWDFNPKKRITTKKTSAPQRAAATNRESMWPVP